MTEIVDCHASRGAARNDIILIVASSQIPPLTYPLPPGARETKERVSRGSAHNDQWGESDQLNS
jgi:hypothetical protein